MAEEAAAAMEVEQKEAVLQGKPDESLFVLDAAGLSMSGGGWKRCTRYSVLVVCS